MDTMEDKDETNTARQGRMLQQAQVIEAQTEHCNSQKNSHLSPPPPRDSFICGQKQYQHKGVPFPSTYNIIQAKGAFWY